MSRLSILIPLVLSVVVGCGGESAEERSKGLPVRELVFPAAPGAPGSTLPEHGCNDPNPSAKCRAIGGFRRLDYEGWSTVNGVNERMTWQADPAGSGKTVAKMEVYGDDRADAYGGTRANAYKTPDDNCIGCEAWITMGIYIPVGFQLPDRWFLLYQNHGRSGNPPQALELRAGTGCESRMPRDHLCWKDQTSPDSGASYVHIAAIPYGHWFYITEHILFETNSTGYDKVWYAQDAPPDVTKSLIVDYSGNTLYDVPGFVSMLLYRGASSHSQHQTVYYCGFHRAASSVTAMVLRSCPLGQVPAREP